MDVHEVPVPERFLPLVYRVLADAYEGEAPSPSGGLVTPDQPPGRGRPTAEWTREEVMRMYREGTPALRAVFDHLAEHAGHDVRSRDLAHAVYPDDNVDEAEGKLYGVLGAFGRKASGYGKDSWFFGAERERRDDGSLGYFVYCMPPREAAWVEEASGRV
jgi:hypothetical protein